MKLMFVDDRMDEITRLLNFADCNEHELAPLETFKNLERTLELVREHKPDVIIIGHGLSSDQVNGADVIRHLRENGLDGRVIANSGGGAQLFERDRVSVDASADRNPDKLTNVLNQISTSYQENTMTVIANNYIEAEKLVTKALAEGNNETLEAALQCFYDHRLTDTGTMRDGERVKAFRQRFEHHFGWIHSLSHFNKDLWDRRMTNWIHKLNEVAYTGGFMGSYHNSSRLMSNFIHLSKPDDHPRDFGFTEENLEEIRQVIAGKGFADKYDREDLAGYLPLIEERL
jgi:CheY-like chemotaxis protein